MKRILPILSLMLFFTLFFTDMIEADVNTTASSIQLDNIENFVDDYVKVYIGKQLRGPLWLLQRTTK